MQKEVQLPGQQEMTFDTHKPVIDERADEMLFESLKGVTLSDYVVMQVCSCMLAVSNSPYFEVIQWLHDAGIKNLDDLMKRKDEICQSEEGRRIVYAVEQRRRAQVEALSKYNAKID